jgi:nitrite reductase (NADH) small subunit
MTWIKVASRNEIHESSGKEVKIGNNRIALFCSKGEFFAIDALCRHQDGSLAPGKLDGEIVECPLHSWHYNIRTGELLDYLKGVKLKTYNVNVRDKDIFVEI